MLRQDSINQIRQGKLTSKFTWLLESFMADDTAFLNLNASDQMVTSQNKNYLSFPFGVTLPQSAGGEVGASITITIPRFTHNTVDPNEIKKVHYLYLKFIDIAYPENFIFPRRKLFLLAWIKIEQRIQFTLEVIS